jgi:hypothetical protein
MSALRDKILNAKDIKSEVVHVDEWDADVEIRGLSGAERASLVDKATVKETDGEGKHTSRVDQSALYPLLIIATAYEPGGEKLFTDGDRDAINGKSAGALEKVAAVSMRLSGMGDQTVIAKNSATTLSADSASASPAI